MNKKITLASLTVLLICGAFNFADEILDKLGVHDPRYQVLNNVLNSYVKPTCSSGCHYFTIPRAAKLTDILSGDRKALAKESCEWLRSYCESADFHAAYQRKRLSEKPYNESPATIDQQSVDSYKELLANAKASLKTARTAQEKAMWSKMITENEYGLEQLQQEYPRTWEWNQKYPESTDSVVVRALRFYLSEAATVDFNAQLTQKGKIKIFSNPEYERKSNLWKAIYRAGKDVNEETKAFVNAWLKEGVHVSTEGYTAPEEKKSEVRPAASSGATTTEKMPEKTEDKTEKPGKKAGGFLKKIKKVLD